MIVIRDDYNIPARRNGDWDETIEFIDTSIDGPLNLTGWKARMQVRLYPGAPDPPLIDIGTDLAPMTGGSDIVFNGDPDLGVIYVAIRGADLRAALDPAMPCPAQFSHDIVLIAPDGTVQPYLSGSFALAEGVTTT